MTISRLGADLFHQFQQLGQCCQSLIQRLAARGSLVGYLRLRAVDTQAIPHHRGRADEVGLRTNSSGHAP